MKERKKDRKKERKIERKKTLFSCCAEAQTDKHMNSHSAIKVTFF